MPHPTLPVDPAGLTDEHDWVARRVAARYSAALPRGGARDDLLQECRVALYRAAVKYDPARGVPFPAFAGVVVGRAARAHVRAESRRGFAGLSAGGAGGYPSAVPGPGDEVSAVDLLEAPAPAPAPWDESRWRRVLGCLTARQREVVVGRLFHCRSNLEVGRQLGFGASRAANLWREAVDKIRDSVTDLEDP